MKYDLKEYAINTNDSNKTQEWYIKKSESGLWGSEEILIKKYFNQKSSILDIGCGTGRTTIHLHNLGYNVIGTDISPMMIKNAKKIAKLKNLEIKYEIGDATNLNYKNSSFDNILFSFNGWSQIPGQSNRIRAFEKIYRTLRPGGFFIFTSHLRKMRGFRIFWIQKWINIHILKRIGFDIKENEFGDYFYIEGNGDKYFPKQYIHFPHLKDVKRQIAKVGFDLTFFARGNTISTKTTREDPPMFFVCKKIK